MVDLNICWFVIGLIYVWVSYVIMFLEKGIFFKIYDDIGMVLNSILLG